MPPYSPFRDGVSRLAQLPPPPTLGNLPPGMDEVEQLLQATHDDVLLKLSFNSHVARSAFHSLDHAASKLTNLLSPLHPSRDQNLYFPRLKLTTS
ncbi:hypothetical protein CRG98_041268 [Punica granatum]|uniref:Uncharacterized protein n=1 Tax=Punica granatum TaxID=22663 RepID=A0A2I0I343_PUNGR|nr:hypothetical protein CRG98_041268 [Punica granatum]